VFRVQPRVLIDNEASRTHTVVEVNGRDRPGLLYDVTGALTGLSLQISSAKVSTYGERAVDVFYVKDVFGLKIEHEGKLAKIRARLMAALAEPARPGKARAAE
jgi:[protein-PII] uridylyltransferase